MRTTAILLASLLLPLAPAAHAEDVVVRVSYADLDLGNAAHVATLEQRVSLAVKSACQADMPVEWRTDAERDCHRIAMKQARREIERQRRNQLAVAGL